MSLAVLSSLAIALVAADAAPAPPTPGDASAPPAAAVASDKAGGSSASAQTSAVPASPAAATTKGAKAGAETGAQPAASADTAGKVESGHNQTTADGSAGQAKASPWDKGITLQFFGGGSSNLTGSQAAGAAAGDPLQPSNNAKTGVRIELSVPGNMLPSQWHLRPSGRASKNDSLEDWLWNEDDGVFFALNVTGSLGTVQAVNLVPVLQTDGSDDVDSRTFEPFWRSLLDTSVGGLGAKVYSAAGPQWVMFRDYRIRFPLASELVTRSLEWDRTVAGKRDAFSVYSAIWNVGVNPSFEYQPDGDATTKFTVTAEGFIGYTVRGFLGPVVDHHAVVDFLGTNEHLFQGVFAQGSVRINGVGFFIAAPYLFNYGDHFELVGGVIIDEAVVSVGSDFAEKEAPASTKTGEAKDAQGVNLRSNYMTPQGLSP